MPFNGTGTFVRSYNWSNDQSSSVVITASRFDTEDSGFATGLSNCITRDGQSPPIADLPMGGKGFTGVRAAVANGEFTEFAQMNAAIRAGSAVAPSAVNNQSTTYTVLTGDQGKVLDLTGTFFLTGPAAVSGFFFYVRKRDGGGDVTFTPATGVIDGRSSIHIYQENFLIWCDGTNWWTQGRQKGWIDIGQTVLAASVTSLAFSIGFTDTELRDMTFDLTLPALSGGEGYIARLSKSGSYQTTGYRSDVVFTQGGATPQSTSYSSGIQLEYAGNGPMYGDLTLYDFQVSGYQRFLGTSFVIDSGGNNDSTRVQGIQTTIAPVVSVVFQGSTGTASFSTGKFYQRAFRP